MTLGPIGRMVLICSNVARLVHCVTRQYCANGGSRGHVDVAQLVLHAASKRAQLVNTKSTKGRAPLHLVAAAAHCSHTQQCAVRRLGSSNRATLSSSKRDRCRTTPLLALLCDNGATLDLQDTSGATPLLLAARSNNVCAAVYLLERNCNPMLVDATGSSALHVAGQCLCELVQADW